MAPGSGFSHIVVVGATTVVVVVVVAVVVAMAVVVTVVVGAAVVGGLASIWHVSVASSMTVIKSRGTNTSLAFVAFVPFMSDRLLALAGNGISMGSSVKNTSCRTSSPLALRT
jgi:hypothetical protein